MTRWCGSKAGRGFLALLADLGQSVSDLSAVVRFAHVPQVKPADATALVMRQGIVKTAEAVMRAAELAFPDLRETDDSAGEGDDEDAVPLGGTD